MKDLMTAACSEWTNEELAVLARNDQAALETLVRRNEGFVILMVSEFQKRNGYHDPNDFEDYCQICRISIVKAVKNFDPGAGTKFITYAGRIMRNDMMKQLEKDKVFCEKVAGELNEEIDTTAEECDEEYGDAYDNRFEDRRSYDLDILPSSVIYIHKTPVPVERTEIDDEARSARLGHYFGLIREILEEGTEEAPKDPSKRDKRKIKYENNKETEHSWKYPVFHEALQDLQINKILKELFDNRFDSAQREYLIYRFGLKDLVQKNLKETAEHFHLRVSYARKIEEEGLETLRDKLCKDQLL